MKTLLTLQTLRQMIIFVAVGGASALVDIGVIWGLLNINLSYLLAVSGGFAAGLVVNYFLHLHVTFVSSFSRKSVFRFLIVTLINYGLTLLIIFIAKEVFTIDVLIGKIISLPFIAMNGYMLARYWIFADPQIKGHSQ